MNQRIAKKVVRAILQCQRRHRRGRRGWSFDFGGYSKQQQRQAIRTIGTERLRKLVEVEVTGYLWGSAHKFTPVLVSERVGDGGRLMYLSPINDRPAYFVARVPTYGDAYDFLYDVYNAAEDEHRGYSECDSEECDCDCEECFAARHFPNASFSDGSSWSFAP